MKAFTENPSTCMCESWGYAHPRLEIWTSVQVGQESIPLGHHPECPYYYPPPHESLSGLGETLDPAKLSAALAALSLAYGVLYRALNPNEFAARMHAREEA